MAVASIRAAGVRRDPRLRRMRTDQMKPGVVLRQPIYAEDGVLLLAGGVRVDSLVISRLIQRGVTAVWVLPSELAHLTGRNKERRVPGETKPSPRKAFLERPPVQGTVQYDHRLQGRVTTSRRVAVTEVASLFRTCDIVRPGDLEVFEDLTITSLAQMSEDSDLFVSREALTQGTEYPAQQAVQSSSVALAIGARMGLEKRDMATLGIGCLVHDLGMMRMNVDAIRQAGTDERSARLELMKHPAITFDMLGNVAQRAGPARIVAYQIHERMNGSGFPRGREGNQIHPLSRIAAVADTYARFVSATNPEATAYDAVLHLIQGAAKGLFDAEAVRGLLKAVSLFPIGSLVELNDGRIAQVLRANGDAFTRPVIEAWSLSDDTPPQLVDLLKHADIHILRVVPHPPPEPVATDVPGLVASLRDI